MPLKKKRPSGFKALPVVVRDPEAGSPVPEADVVVQTEAGQDSKVTPGNDDSVVVLLQPDKAFIEMNEVEFLFHIR
jgi:hypothetical protein